MCFLIFGRSVGITWRPGTSAQYPWSLETRKNGYKVNMAAMKEGKIDVVVKPKREQHKKDKPLF